MKLLHKIIFWSHLLAGVIAGVVIFIMSATGVILMYEHQLVEFAERDVRQVVPPAGAQRLSLDELIAKARAQNPDTPPSGVVLRNETTAAVAVGFGREGATYVNPYPALFSARARNCTNGFMTLSIGTAGSARKAKAAPPAALSPAFVILPFSGLPLPEFICGGRAVGTGAD